MEIRICEDRKEVAELAAMETANIIRRVIAAAGRVRVLVDSGELMNDALDALREARDIMWAEVDLFHTGEFLGVGIDHCASGRNRLVARLIENVRPGRYHLLDGAHDPERVCREEGELLRAAAIDVALVAVGEGGSLAFNEPPADFATEKPYLIMRLDEGRRQRECAHGAFATAADVPDRAISISIRQLMQTKAIVCVAAGASRAEAVRRCREGPVSPFVPASVLHTHPAATLVVDRDAASLLGAVA